MAHIVLDLLQHADEPVPRVPDLPDRDTHDRHTRERHTRERHTHERHTHEESA